MGATDAPAEPAKSTEVRRMKAPSEERFKELLSSTKKSDGEKKSMISNQGQIAKLPVPEGWVETTTVAKLPPTANYAEYHKEGSKEAKFGTFYRGHKISDSAAKNFHAMLQKSGRDLTAAEYASLAEVLRDKAKADDFSVSKKRVDSIKGKNVLVVEGTFLASKQKAYFVYVDADGTGSVVQEIFFQAPEQVYKSDLENARKAISSISWK